MFKLLKSFFRWLFGADEPKYPPIQPGPDSSAKAVGPHRPKR